MSLEELQDLRKRLRKYQSIPQKTATFMRRNVYGKNGVTKDTGKIKNTIHVEYLAYGTYAIGPEAYSHKPGSRYDEFPYGRVVRWGRSEVWPKSTSPFARLNFKTKDGEWHSVPYVSAWKPKSDFIMDTLNDLQEYMDQI